MSEALLMNPIPKYNISPQFQSDRIYNESMDDEFSDTEYDLSPKDDVPSPSKRGRSQIQNGIRRSPNKWTEEEDQKLFQLVNIYGEKKWKRISAEMGGQKTGAQCAQHWKRVLSPDIRKGPWDEDEEELLLRLVNQHGSSWKKIAKRICKRTDIQCRYQYLKSLQSREVSWVPKEDDVLLKKVDEMGENLSWLEVSEYLAKLKHTNTLRTALECKTRYNQLTGKAGNILPPLNSNSQYHNQQMSYGHPMQHMSHHQMSHMGHPMQMNHHQMSHMSQMNHHQMSQMNHHSSNKSLSPLSSLIDSNNSSPSFESCSSEETNHTPPNIFRPTPHKPTINNTISNLTSPSSSPIPSSPIPSSPPSSSLSSPCNNNSNSINNNQIHRNSPVPTHTIKNTLPSISYNNSNFNKNSAFSINNIIDCKKEEEEDSQPVMKKVRSNGEFYYQPINNNNNNIKKSILNNSNNSLSCNSDNSSDDDMLPKIKKQNIINNNNNNKNISFNNTTSPLSSPYSSPNHSSIEKLKATSFDFFNLESLATIASSQSHHHELVN
ncbi:hypothetical protein DICPUDRAFT_92812 [Dictyostelium purpureum]|uniref:Myb transcription factor n=1 Tax=Dictyostelium purpureum TaxID=5786 RepID=F0ZXK7_DICPU|nr:uncharacterized protein DICPUDRAFT_92812 [Dictyostelium purpureum]EGC31307.1 hypothetical protein DICPUDRAFT_92812 [Dictyostelium purpureum]|eukprot:XP_003292151.1 hypothetical protein DICPUDRAFT_92812 [Dictyostelium purpureum]